MSCFIIRVLSNIQTKEFVVINFSARQNKQFLLVCIILYPFRVKVKMIFLLVPFPQSLSPCHFQFAKKEQLGIRDKTIKYPTNTPQKMQIFTFYRRYILGGENIENKFNRHCLFPPWKQPDIFSVQNNSEEFAN